MLGVLVSSPALGRPELLAAPVAAALRAWSATVPVEQVHVAEIDPGAADTAAFCARYQVPMEASANCVVVATRRGAQGLLVACVVLASTRADVNGLVRRQVGARKASFAPMELAVSQTGMEYGGITPLGLPADWPVLSDAAVAEAPLIVVGSGLRRSKLVLPGRALAELRGAQVLQGLGVSAAGG